MFILYLNDRHFETTWRFSWDVGKTCTLAWFRRNRLVITKLTRHLKINIKLLWSQSLEKNALYSSKNKLICIKLFLSWVSHNLAYSLLMQKMLLKFRHFSKTAVIIRKHWKVFNIWHCASNFLPLSRKSVWLATSPWCRWP